MKKGFTLLELIIVIVILGVLATLGFAQYTRMVERARGAEARTILGTIRTQAVAYRMEHGGNLSGFNNAAGIGNAEELIPSNCRNTHYFAYSITNTGNNTFTATATRCIANGKEPQATTALTLNLTTNFSNGMDSWAGTGGY